MLDMAAAKKMSRAPDSGNVLLIIETPQAECIVLTRVFLFMTIFIVNFIHIITLDLVLTIVPCYGKTFILRKRPDSNAVTVKIENKRCRATKIHSAYDQNPVLQLK